ncbi:hypothetical protein RIVM261_077030 [Rivularia sp. IAM M-261]|nr:hypothetical protein RIVM261_077030 [Rivularia sp. IAM M-261]
MAPSAVKIATEILGTALGAASEWGERGINDQQDIYAAKVALRHLLSQKLGEVYEVQCDTSPIFDDHVFSRKMKKPAARLGV